MTVLFLKLLMNVLIFATADEFAELPAAEELAVEKAAIGKPYPDYKHVCNLIKTCLKPGYGIGKSSWDDFHYSFWCHLCTW